jgi:DNA-binding beta-propeller fold protein YncE
MRSLLLTLLVAPVALAAAPAGNAGYRLAAPLAAGDGGWDLASVDSADQRLYVARTDGVTAIDLRSGKAVDRIVSGERLHAALAIPGSHDVLSTNGGTNNLFLFDGRTGRIRATLPTGTKPDAAAYDPATRTAWIMNPGSGDATVVDPAAARVLATVPVGGSLELAVADGRGRLYVNVEDRNQMVVIDTRSRKVSARFTLQGCDGPTGIAYATAGGRGEILSACANGVAVVTAANGRQIARLPIGRGADGAAYDPKKDVALVPAGRDGKVTLISLAKGPKVIGEVSTAVSARTIALDGSSGRVYLPSATLSPAGANERPRPVPGSFRVLVLEPGS